MDRERKRLIKKLTCEVIAEAGKSIDGGVFDSFIIEMLELFANEPQDEAELKANIAELL